MNVLTIRNGAKGISVFIFIFPILLLNKYLDENITVRLTIAPIQNDKIIAEKPK